MMTKKQWDEVVAKYPPGLYAVYGPSGEKEWMVRGYTEAPCGVVGVWMVDPDDIKHCVVYCPQCNANVRPELIRPLEA